MKISSLKVVCLALAAGLLLPGRPAVAVDIPEYWAGMNKDGNRRNSNARSLNGTPRVKWANVMRGLQPYGNPPAGSYQWGVRSLNLSIRDGRILCVIPRPAEGSVPLMSQDGTHAWYGLTSLADGSLLHRILSPHFGAGQAVIKWGEGTGIMGSEQTAGLIFHYWNRGGPNGTIYTQHGGDAPKWSVFDPYTLELPFGIVRTTMVLGMNQAGSFNMSDANPDICTLATDGSLRLLSGGTYAHGGYPTWGGPVIEGNWGYPYINDGAGHMKIYGIEVTGPPFSAAKRWTYTSPSTTLFPANFNTWYDAGHEVVFGAPRPVCLGEDSRFYWYGRTNEQAYLVGVNTTGGVAGTEYMSVSVPNSETVKDAGAYPQIATIGTNVVIFQPQQPSYWTWFGERTAMNGQILCFETVSKTLAWRKDFTPGYFNTEVRSFMSGSDVNNSPNRGVQMTIAGDSAYIVEPYSSSGNLTIRVQKFTLATGAQTTTVLPVESGGSPIAISDSTTVMARDVAAVDGTLVCLVDFDLTNQVLAAIDGDGGSSVNYRPVAVMSAPLNGLRMSFIPAFKGAPTNEFDSGTAIAFSAEGSHDPEGGALTYFWNFGDGAVSAEKNPTHTYAAVGAALSVSNRTVTLTVTDGGGIASLPVTRALAIRNVGTVQAHSLTPEADATADVDKPNTNTGGSSILASYEGSGNGNVRRRPYIRFDLASVDTASLVSAKLVLAFKADVGNTFADMYGHSIVARATSNNWGEMTLTWNNAPAIGDLVGQNDRSAMPGGSLLQGLEIPISTDYIKAAKAADGKVSFTVEIEPAIASSYLFYSSREGDSAPRLILRTGDTGAAPLAITRQPVSCTLINLFTTNMTIAAASPQGDAAIVYHWYVAWKPYGTSATNSPNHGGTATNVTFSFSALGAYKLYCVVADGASQLFSDTVTVNVVPLLPSVTITSPSNGSYVTNPLLDVSGTASRNGGSIVTSVTVNAASVSTSDGYTNWTARVTLVGGANPVIATAANINGATVTTNWVVYADETFSGKSDGVPDLWKIQNWGWSFTNDPASDATADPDGDGMNNLGEYQAGTVPTNIESVLKINQLVFQGDTLVLQWQSVSGRIYQVRYCPSLANWLNAGSPITAISGVSTWTDDGAQTGGTPPGQTGQRFYRIKLPRAGCSMPITFSGYTNRTEVLTNFPVLVVFSNEVGSSGFSFSNHPFVTTNGYDLRFYTNTTDTGSGLNYEIESWNTNAASYVWVQVPLIPTNGMGLIYARWGDPAASNQLACTTNGAVWMNDFAGVWHMGQTNAQDSTANRNNGTAYANTNATGFIGGAQGFNGSSAYIDVGNGTSVRITGNKLTQSAWIKPASNVQYGTILTRRSAYYFQRHNDQKLGAYQFGTTPAGYHYSTGTAPLNAWIHAAIVYDGSFIRFFLNGVESGNVAKIGNVTQTASHPLRIGWDGDAGQRLWNGLLDEVRLCAVARSTNWIWAEWCNMASNTAFSTYGAVDGRDDNLP